MPIRDVKRRAFLRGLYEMQAQILHVLQSIDSPSKGECYRIIAALNPLDLMPKDLS